MSRPFRVVNLGPGPSLGTNEQAPLPKPDGALYRHPNPDGSRKRCDNCVMWISKEDRCSIHLPDQVVQGSAWCGYHIFGKPMEKSMPHEGSMQAVTPDISGLRPAGPGVACASCLYYKDQGGGKGLCYGVSKPDDRRPPQPVELMGICARYEAM